MFQGCHVTSLERLNEQLQRKKRRRKRRAHSVHWLLRRLLTVHSNDLIYVSETVFGLFYLMTNGNSWNCWSVFAWMWCWNFIQNIFLIFLKTVKSVSSNFEHIAFGIWVKRTIWIFNSCFMNWVRNVCLSSEHLVWNLSSIFYFLFWRMFTCLSSVDGFIFESCLLNVSCFCVLILFLVLHVISVSDLRSSVWV